MGGIKHLGCAHSRRAPALPSCGGTFSGASSPGAATPSQADMKLACVALLLVLHLLASQVRSASTWILFTTPPPPFFALLSQVDLIRKSEFCVIVNICMACVEYQNRNVLNGFGCNFKSEGWRVFFFFLPQMI